MAHNLKLILVKYNHQYTTLPDYLLCSPNKLGRRIQAEALNILNGETGASARRRMVGELVRVCEKPSNSGK